jgi:excisionase family DNA binding protein
MDLGGALCSRSGCGAGVDRLEDRDMIEQHYSAREIATLLKVDHSTVTRRIAAGDMRGVKIGKRVIVPESEVARFLELNTLSRPAPLPVRRGIRPMIASL